MTRPTPDDLSELPTDPQDDDPRAAADAYVLTVVEGPDAGTSVTLDPASPARVLLGKSATATLRLHDGEISRRHAAIRAEKGVLVLADLGSTNGTTVNGVAVREATLRGGEAIRLGRTVLSVSRGAPIFVALTNDRAFGRLLGGSRAMRVLYSALHRFSRSEHPVLLEGEAGAGKELCAEEIHAHSPRASRPFLVLSCHALPARALEERLLGDGGILAEASGGTVYVDEVAALPAVVQRRLARELPPRVLFGTRRDLDRDVAEGRFDDDLLARLAPVRIELPPLRDRDDDVELLARAFWTALVAETAARNDVPESPTLPADFLPRFHRYRWPGNVGELSGAVQARWATGELSRWRGSEASRDRRDPLQAIVERELPLAETRQLVIDELERRYVEHMLGRHRSTRDAAQASGVGVRYFQMLRARFER